MRLFLSLTGVGLILAGVAYLFFPHAAVGLAGMELTVAPAAIDVRATYGGTQIGVGLFLLWCRSREDSARTGLVLILLWAGCVASSRIYGILVDGDPGWFNALGVTLEVGFVVVAALLLWRARAAARRTVYETA